MKYDIVFSSSNSINMGIALRLLHSYGYVFGVGVPMFGANASPSGTVSTVLKQPSVTIAMQHGAKLLTILTYGSVASMEGVKKILPTTEADQYYALEGEGGSGLTRFMRAVVRLAGKEAAMPQKSWTLSSGDGGHVTARADKAQKAVVTSNGTVTLAQLKELQRALVPRRLNITVAGYDAEAVPARGIVRFGCLDVPLATINEMIAELEK